MTVMNIEWCELIGCVMHDESVTAPWLMVLESVSDATHLKIEAEGEWKMEASVVPGCGPDGLAGFGLPGDQLVMAGCRYGALIGKIGGSSAAHRAPAQAAAAAGAAPGAGQGAGAVAVDEPFAIGAFCLHKLPGEPSGPLFIGFNTLWRPIGVKAMKLRIFGGRVLKSGSNPDDKAKSG
jgi:hypothetical protein